MGIDLHALNFVGRQASTKPLGAVLTIGRQTMSVPPEVVRSRLGELTTPSAFCEPFLRAIGATSVESVDYSDYEGATYIADLGKPSSLPVQFDTIIDSGSLEHVFDVACAFRNVIGFCRVGGRIIHILPVNNLSGHGFWQFSSDLMYSIYSEDNGFSETEVYYASSLDAGYWYKVPKARAGVRVELVSIEPIVLLCVTRRASEVGYPSVVQPFYAPSWAANQQVASTALAKTALLQRILLHLPRGALRNFFRNSYRIIDLCFGLSRYSLRSSYFERIAVPKTLPRPARLEG